MQHVLRGIVVHIANVADVVIDGGDGEFVRIEHGSRFVPCPGEIVAIVVELDIGVLRCVEATLLAVAESTRPSSA